MTQMDRIRAVTSNYFFWQGLRLVPLGPVLIVAGLNLAPPAWWPFARYGDLVLFVIVAAALIAFKMLGGYYERTFGSVRDTPGQHRTREVIKWLLVYPAMFAAMLLDAILAPKLAFSGIVWGAALVLYWWSTGQGRVHYLLSAAVLAFLSFTPLIGLVDPGRELVAVVMVVVGIMYMAAGVLDHMELLRILPPAPEDGTDASTL